MADAFSTSSLSPDSILPSLAPHADKPLLVAFSGGVDSTVLLHLLVSLRDRNLLKDLLAVHIDHGLSQHAEDWSDHCKSVCKQLSVPFIVRKILIEGSSDIELQARNQRYQVFEELLPEGGCLLMGHHQDDQAETLLFRLFRGSGVDGLAGIPVSRSLGQGALLRPLLSCSRQQIEAYAQENSLSNIEDDSNTDQTFRRNYLRHGLIPEIERQWPGVSGRLSALSEELFEVSGLLADLAETEYQNVSVAPPGVVWGPRELLVVDKLLSLSRPVVNRVLRFWLGKYECPMPDRQHLEIIVSEIAEAKQDAEPCIKLSSVEVRRSGNYLVLLKASSVSSLCHELIWNPLTDSELKLADGSFLVMNSSELAEISDLQVTVKYREHLPDGLKVRVAGRKGSKTVKRWLQDYKVPPWMRNRIPFLFVDGRMVAAAGLWHCDELSEPEQIAAHVTWSHVE
ncbi:tRNA lysidine(34) synthetase TilS [Endozoicomonas sp. OPT23]|uniref:tRNA lysidine(34) synthetase TilS n=1 Tax=Endozoicomonas sp. OPT23 TaxID=2072845 RepID=UPI00129B718A|nr:tRNA lysidine(34) synthetase TilS [Endozoicomonas sp. OPT23]MRI34942.1 tRNA lysidine(34) synthetase TilS [Endozoicomonas sp. OPT23]